MSDGVLGERSVDTRAAFVQLMQAHSVLAQPEDMQWLVTRAVKDDRSAAPSGILMFKAKAIPAAEADAAPKASSESSKHLCCTSLQSTADFVTASVSILLRARLWHPLRCGSVLLAVVLTMLLCRCSWHWSWEDDLQSHTDEAGM